MRRSALRETGRASSRVAFAGVISVRLRPTGTVSRLPSLAMPLPSLPLQFVLKQGHLSWQEAREGVRRGWLHPRAAIELADLRRAEGLVADPVASDLADRGADDAVLDAVEILASRETRQTPEAVVERWLRAHVVWLVEHPPSDPLPAVEEMWCELDHPKDLEQFIPGLPAPNPKEVMGRSREENLRRMRGAWFEYAATVRAGGT
jgi:hypothetical protein